MPKPGFDFEPPPRERRIYCNRTLNLRAIEAIGFDMDYTLVHYQAQEWERYAYQGLRHRLAGRGWPVSRLRFDPGFAVLGLILDLHTGNVVKADRFGYVKQACHGTVQLDFDQQRSLYSRVLVDLGEPRWRFLNTLFSLSEACMYAQLVELLDGGRLPAPMDYAELHRVVRSSLDEAHAEGDIKDRIASRPDRFVTLDEELPLALLDARRAGKRLVLITNSEWSYTRDMMAYAFDRFLPQGTGWRDLFDLKIVEARKPGFFTEEAPVFELVDEEGHLLPRSGRLRDGGVYLGGHAGLVERHFGLRGEQILYVGDHIYADVQVSKRVQRWRTALIVRALEQELLALQAFQESQRRLSDLMARKEQLEHRQAWLRLQLQRTKGGYGPPSQLSARRIESHLGRLRGDLARLDRALTPLAQAHSGLANPRWGLLMRAGNDKSHLARQIEQYADVYTSRVSNLLLATPFAYFRAGRTTLPHDVVPVADWDSEV